MPYLTTADLLRLEARRNLERPKTGSKNVIGIGLLCVTGLLVVEIAMYVGSYAWNALTRY
jgi:hypothetical protein